jgi:ribose 5-phosphate isomerase B
MSTTSAEEVKPIFRKVTVASDHAAFDLKKQVIDYIKEKYGSSIELYDAGVYSADPMDYPDIARVLCTSIQKSQFGSQFLLFCSICH